MFFANIKFNTAFIASDLKISLSYAYFLISSKYLLYADSHMIKMA